MRYVVSALTFAVAEVSGLRSGNKSYFVVKPSSKQVLLCSKAEQIIAIPTSAAAPLFAA